MKKYLLILLVSCSCTSSKKIQPEDQTNHFPVVEEKVKALPAKNKFFIFLMAGQSNMAGRGIVHPEDTISSPLVLALNKNNEWVYAKEPLHYYEPGRTGLDCGLSFGKKLAALYGNDIVVGLVPCAIGGSSIEQWLGDSTYRGVQLYTNFLNKANVAMQAGTLKGLLWHQGESNASPKGYMNYKERLETFFAKVRSSLQQPTLPIYAGQLASFLKKNDNPHAGDVNNDLQAISSSLKNVYIISTGDLTSKSDTLHFNAQSQRMMGERFAQSAYEHR